MSWIRSTSNPERLYIWVGAGDVNICQPSPYPTRYVPVETFETVIDLYNGVNEHLNEYKWNGNDGLSYKGLTIEERIIDGVGLRVVMSYQDWQIVMWPVTWHYIASRK